VKEGRDCKKFAFFGVSLDSQSRNKKAMELIEKAVNNGTIDWRLALLNSFPDYYHLFKTLFMGTNNWWLWKDGFMFCLELLLVLRLDPHCSGEMSDLGVTIDAVRCKDRHATHVIAQRSQLWKFLEKIGWVVLTIVPSLRRLWQVRPVALLFGTSVTVSERACVTLSHVARDSVRCAKPAEHKYGCILGKLAGPGREIHRRGIFG